MKEINDIEDNQIRILGSLERKNSKKISGHITTFIVIALILFTAIVFFFFLWHNHNNDIDTDSQVYIYENNIQNTQLEKCSNVNFSSETTTITNSSAPSFIEIRDTVINDIPLRIYIPHNAKLTLHIGKMDLNDESVIYASQAADIRADNGGIVGAYVLNGEPRSWGLSKEGFCASINGKVTIGVAKNSPLFEKATEEGGCFFRQYPLVDKGEIVQNRPKGKSIRRSICDRNGMILMVESLNKVSFYEFSKSLVSLGIDNAIYLIGSSSYGWAVDKNNKRHEFGDKKYYSGKYVFPENINYVVWKRK